MNRQQLKLIPRSTATNAYDLMADVVKVIRDEPKRMDMSTFTRLKMKFVPKARRPACGTIGCVAGWMVMLTMSDEHLWEIRDAGLMSEWRAQQLLPSSVRGAASRLFYSMVHAGDDGTPAYAEEVITLIEAFMRDHEAALRAHVLTEEDNDNLVPAGQVT